MAPPVAWLSRQAHARESPPRVSCLCVLVVRHIALLSRGLCRLNHPFFAYPNRSITCTNKLQRQQTEHKITKTLPCNRFHIIYCYLAVINDVSRQSQFNESGKCPNRMTAARPISKGMIHRQTIFCLFMV